MYVYIYESVYICIVLRIGIVLVYLKKKLRVEKRLDTGKKRGVRRTLHEQKKIVSKFITSFDLLDVVVWLMNLSIIDFF